MEIVSGSTVNHRDGMAETLWRLCYTSEEITQAINEFKSLSTNQRRELRASSRKLREMYYSGMCKTLFGATFNDVYSTPRRLSENSDRSEGKPG